MMTEFKLAAARQMSASAALSPCGTYRWELHRRWRPGPSVLWVMLNPSTADSSTDDPTIRRCIGFARSWDFGALAVANLFAFRSPHPATLASERDPVGPENDEVLARLASEADLVVAAWGAHPAARERADEVWPLLGDACCVGVTRDGHPRHPLYVRAAATPQPLSRWRAEPSGGSDRLVRR